jgi:hypothetical protein
MHDRDLKYYPVTRAPNTEGLLVATLGTAVTFRGDHHPLGKNPSRLAEYGLDSTEANAGQLYYDIGLSFEAGGVIEEQDTLLKFMVSGPPRVYQGHIEAITVKWNG